MISSNFKVQIFHFLLINSKAFNPLIQIWSLFDIQHLCWSGICLTPTIEQQSFSVQISSLLFPGGTHCYIDSKTGAKVLAQPSTAVFYGGIVAHS